MFLSWKNLRPLVLGAALVACLAPQAHAQTDTIIIPFDETLLSPDGGRKSFLSLLDLAVGLNYCALSDMPTNIAQESLGRGVSLGLTTEINLGNRFQLLPGLSISQDNFYYNVFQYLPTVLVDINGNVLTQNILQPYNGNPPGNEPYKLNKLRQTWVDVPVELRLLSGQRGAKGRLYIGVGGQVGVQLDALRKIRFDFPDMAGSDNEGVRKTKRDNETDNLMRLRYGVRASLGYGKVGVQGMYMFSDLLETNPAGGNVPRAYMVGLVFRTGG